MANSLKASKVLYFDTTGATSAITTPVKIRWLTWVSDDGTNLDIAADDDFTMHDAVSGNVLFKKRAEAAGDGLELSFGDGYVVPGLYLTEMDGGILLIGT